MRSVPSLFESPSLEETRSYYTRLNEVIAGRAVRGKAIELTRIDSFENLLNFHVLVVAAETRVPFSEIALKARRTHTLVISEDQEDQIYIMINLLPSAGNHYSFEINTANILLERLSLSDDILLLGGSELDVAKLYREMEEDLSLLLGKIDSTQAQSLLASAALADSQNHLDKAQRELFDTQEHLQTMNETLETQNVVIVDQKESIVSRQAELKLATASAVKNQELLGR
jgi:hypothetical protein